MPIIRPVACFDKLEIMSIARKIDTYDISIIPYEDCCTVFVPKHPVIRPNLKTAMEEEEKFSYLPMIEEAVENVYTKKITDEKEQEFSELL